MRRLRRRQVAACGGGRGRVTERFGGRFGGRAVRGAFTLVELLVVIGIIAILISILLPSLNRARQHAYSAQCLSNLRQVGQAALMYAGENHGWFPPGHAANPNAPGGMALSRSDASFVDWGKVGPDGSAPNQNRWSVSEAMARYAGYKWSPNWVEYTGTSADVATNRANGWSPARTPVFFCPTYNQLVSGAEFPDDNLLNHDSTLVGNNGNSCTKMSYLWVANPYHNVCPATLAAIAANHVSEDQLAAGVTLPLTNGGGFCHMDRDPLQENHVDFDTSRPCTPGFDYLRKTSDKHAADVAICVDNARQAGSGFFFYPHGSMTGWRPKAMPPATNGQAMPPMTIADRAWFNELFGDGHCESRRGDQLRLRWSSANPQAW